MREIKSRTVHGKISVRQVEEEDSLHQQNGYKFEKETSRVIFWSTDVCVLKLDTSERRSEIPGELEKDGEDQLPGPSEK
jgi:hypothetical protein